MADSIRDMQQTAASIGDAFVGRPIPSAAYNAPIFVNMGALMKTTIDLSDALFESAKELARRRQTTLRALIEDGLRHVLGNSEPKVKRAFKLKDARVHGKAVLLPDPRAWRQLEEDHVIARTMKPRA